jgi:tetratricopeptide (TPR) repeat protein
VSIEEFDLLKEALEGYDKVRTDQDTSTSDLIYSLAFFRETPEPAGPLDRVIFDARSWINGMPFTSISGKYWDVYLGRGLLLESFESGFMGAAEGESKDFRFTFPEDYMEQDLQGRTVDVNLKIRKVFKPIRVNSIEEVARLDLRNHYPFPDLDFLANGNEILYYLALRDAGLENLVKTPRHFLMLAHKKAKLGKLDDVREMFHYLEGKPSAVSALGDTLAAAGKFDSALEYYEDVASDQPQSVLKRVRCLLGMGRGQEALDLIGAIPESPDLDFQETLLQCLKQVNGDTRRIPSLEHRVMDLKIEAALSKAGMMGAKGQTPSPVIHGYKDRND